MAEGMPPANESGFPALSMFGGEVNEWLQSLIPRTLITAQSSPRDGVVTGVEGFFTAEQSHLAINTRVQLGTYGPMMSANLSPMGLQTGIDGLVIPFLPVQLSAQAAFVPQGLAGFMLQGMIPTPIGMVMGSGNAMGQWGLDAITGLQPAPNHSLMLGAHAWGLPGLWGGIKTALEWRHDQMDGEQPVSGSSVVLACTAPFVAANGAPLEASARSVSLSVVHRLSMEHSLMASFDWPADGEGQMTAGGTRQLAANTRLRGKYGTSGVLALALETAVNTSSVSLVAEINTRPSQPLAPKVGATISLSL